MMPTSRLMRFGFEYVEAALAAQGRKIIVIEPDEMTDDIVHDLHEVIVSSVCKAIVRPKIEF